MIFVSLFGVTSWVSRQLESCCADRRFEIVPNYEDKNGKNRTPRKRAGASDDLEADFRGYINLNLSAEQKANFEAWSTSASLWDVFEAQVADGVHLAVKIDRKSQGFFCSATQRRASSPNAGLVVTARAKTAVVAWGRCLFILAILSHSERWEDVQPLADPDRW